METELTYEEHERRLAKALVAWALFGTNDSHGRPISEHCVRVGDSMLADGAPSDRVLAGYLHDLLEDASAFRSRTISDFFGVKVYWLVGMLTRRPGESYGDYIARLCEDYEAAFIKLYDIADNMDESRGPVPGHLAERYAKYWPKLLAATGPIKRFTKEAKWKPNG